MARQKIHPFTIWADTGIPTPEAECGQSLDDELAMKKERYESTSPNYEVIEEEDEDIWEDEEDDVYEQERNHERYSINDHEDDRRESGITTVSSLPESTYQTDNEMAVTLRNPQIIRPSFMRPESVRRMQMSSPPPLHPPRSGRSSRSSYLRQSHSRSGTPRSVRSAHRGGSPRAKQPQSEDDEDDRYYPLVLLHVTILPVSLPWSMKSMQELLPKTTLNNLSLLKTKISESIFQRGILIPHPQDEYELLEEHLLEALELTEERVTKCGHFRNRPSTDSDFSFSDSGRESDSAIGSSIDSLLDDRCTTCRSHIKDSRPGVGNGSSKWSVKVFAANGLMRAPAWAAAWPEMESVDVEVLPWISEEDRMKLDERREEEEELEFQAEETRAREIMEEDERSAHEEARSMALALPLSMPPVEEVIYEAVQHDMFEQDFSAKEPLHDLPQVYRPSQIPLSVLLKNYIFLLAQDRRNVAIFVIGLLSLIYLIQPSASEMAASTAASMNETANAVHILGSSTSLAQVATDVLRSATPLETTSESVMVKALDTPDTPSTSSNPKGYIEEQPDLTPMAENDVSEEEVMGREEL